MMTKSDSAEVANDAINLDETADTSQFNTYSKLIDALQDGRYYDELTASEANDLYSEVLKNQPGAQAVRFYGVFAETSCRCN